MNVRRFKAVRSFQACRSRAATNDFDSTAPLVAFWILISGARGRRCAILGTITRDGNRIHWDNGTYWIRDRLYTQ